MRTDDGISRLWYGAILGASLAFFVASLSSSRSENDRQMDEAWLTAVREQGW